MHLKLAAHKGRRGSTTTEHSAPEQASKTVTGRAALAAERVAARYAKAPTYSEMMAAEAHPVEIASSVADEVQHAAPLLWESETPQVLTSPPSPRHWEPDPEPIQVARALSPKPQGHSSPYPARKRESSQYQPELFATAIPAWEESSFSPIEDGWDSPSLASEAPAFEAIEVAEPVQPIHANLIEFPRELVAPRKARPRLADSPFAGAESERQLSIFEVDPSAFPRQSEPVGVFAAAPDLSVAGWSGIALDAQPTRESASQIAPALQSQLLLAPLSRRLLAVVVDGALIACAFLAAASVALATMEQLPTTRVLGTSGASALLLIGLLYQAIFCGLAGSSPGMKYARICLSTFEDRRPSRTRLQGRFGALLLSLLPVGLGLAWAIFDEDGLCWHDRISRTYLRRI